MNRRCNIINIIIRMCCISIGINCNRGIRIIRVGMCIDVRSGNMRSLCIRNTDNDTIIIINSGGASGGGSGGGGGGGSGGGGGGSSSISSISISISI